MMLARHGVFRMLGPQSQDFDKYSELTAEGKRYSTAQARLATVAERLTAPPWPRESHSPAGCPNKPNLRIINASLPQATTCRVDCNGGKPGHKAPQQENSLPHCHYFFSSLRRRIKVGTSRSSS